MKKRLLWIVAVSLSFVLGQSAFADSGHCGDGLNKMVEHFKLDAAQKAKVTPILDQLKTSLKASGSQMKDLRTQINQQVQSDNMDQATLDGLVDKKAKLIGDMMKAKVTAKHQIFTLLNAQQKTAYQDMVKKWDEKMAAKFANCKAQDQDKDSE
jgi:protein CpxP